MFNTINIKYLKTIQLTKSIIIHYSKDSYVSLYISEYSREDEVEAWAGRVYTADEGAEKRCEPEEAGRNSRRIKGVAQGLHAIYQRPRVVIFNTSYL